MKTLKDAKVDDVVVVKRLHGEGPIKRRIMDMGITKAPEATANAATPPSSAAILCSNTSSVGLVRRP